MGAKTSGFVELWACIGVLAALIGVGCGDGGGSEAADAGLRDGAPSDAASPDSAIVDAAPLPDAFVPSVACDPIEPVACTVGQKCASVTVQASPIINQTLCVPEGPVPEGAACTTGPPGVTTGFADCMAGNECIFGRCRPICVQQGGTIEGTCQGAAVCQNFNNLYEDLASADVGVCIPPCDPVSCNDQVQPSTGICLGTGGQPEVDYSDQCGPLSCYMNVFEGIGVCSGAFEGSPNHAQSCGDSCALNGCAPGSGPFMPGGDLAGWESNAVFFANTIFGLADVCTQFCDTSLWTKIPGDEGSVSSDFQANCPADNECRIVNGLYVNFDDPGFAPDSYGLCIPNSAVSTGAGTAGPFGSCANHVLEDIGGYLSPDGMADPPITTNPDGYSFIPGCSSGQVTFDKIEAINSMQMITPSSKAGAKMTVRRALALPLPRAGATPGDTTLITVGESTDFD